MDWTAERGQEVEDAGALVGRLRPEAEPRQQPSSGVVVPAVDPETDRRYALKLVRGPVGTDAAVRRAARADAIAQSWLEHPRIATLVEHGPLEDGFYLVMSWLDGRSLDVLLRGAPLDPAAAVRIVRDVAEAVAAASTHGIVHRDLTPTKVVVAGDGGASLGDLGAGRRCARDPLPAASYPYAAPELLRGEPPGPAAHEHALAAMLFQALTGDVPPSAAVRSGSWSTATPRASEQRRDLPPELDAVLARGLALDPEERHGSPLAFVDAVELVVRPRPSAAPPADAEDEPGPESHHAWAEDAERPRRSRILPWLVAALVLGAAGLAAGLLAGGEVKDPPAPQAPPGTVGTSELQLLRPAGWRAADPPPAVPWLDPVEQVSMAPVDGTRSTAIVAGMTEPGKDGLLPDALVDRLAQPPGRGQPVRLGSVAGVRYRGLDVRGLAGSPLTLYAVPTNVGTATVACLGQAADELAAQCGRTAATLRLDGPRARPLEPPSERYGRRVERAFDVLDRSRARALVALASAPNRRAQAGAARRLAAAYRRAEARLRRAPDRDLVHGRNERIVAALGTAAAAYGDLSRSARRGDEAGYARARARARTADGAVEAALKSLADEGYTIR